MVKPRALLILALCALSLVPPTWAQKTWQLHIDVPSADRAHAPKVLLDDKTAPGLTLESGSGRWIVPISPVDSEFVTSYVVSLPDKNVVAVRVGVPARILDTNQSIAIIPTSLTQVDEATVRSIWRNNEITSRPSDPKVQFRYLQDLVYIERGVMQRPGAMAHRPNSMRMQASFMLLQVVRNLSQSTWFLVDPSFQDVIDFAIADLSAGQAAGKCQSWLGAPACHGGGVGQLTGTVRSLQGNRLSRMYEALVPAGSALDASTCSVEQMKDMRDFYAYLHQTSEQGDGGKGTNEDRVLNDIARCYSVKALCLDTDPDQAIQTLSEGSHFIEQYGSRATRRRLQELNNALTDLRAGRPARCAASSPAGEN